MEEPTFQPKTLTEVKELLIERVTKQLHPMSGTKEDDVRRACALLQNLEPDHWTQVWTEIARPYEEEAQKQASLNNFSEAEQNYLLAHNYYFIGRFSSPETPSRQKAYRSAVTSYQKAAEYFNPPMEKIAIPFAGRNDEGKEIPAYLRIPQNTEKSPLLIICGGLDEFKEEVHPYTLPFLELGIATLSIDMPGTGEAPVLGSTDAERICTAILDYAEERPDLDSARVGFIGISFGGYWVTKFAHTEQKRLSAVVNWGGCVHYYFQPDWVRKSRHAPSYICDLGLLRANVFGLSTFEEWIESAPQYSLLTQGLLDQPSAPMLLVNGKEDTQVPIEDHYLLLEHGSPKTIRVFPGGHMGRTPQTLPTIVDWLSGYLLKTGL